jgi:hypothetical protein
MYADIDCYDTFAEFIDTIGLTDRDVILSTRPVHQRFLEPLGLGVKTLFVESYGL